MHDILEHSQLGKKSAYDSLYNPDYLFPIARSTKRKDLGIDGKLPFFGYDLWNHYEVSWLNAKGKPMVALAKIIYGCESENIIESKSMKLYFNSFNNTQVKDLQTLQAMIQHDFEDKLKNVSVIVDIIPLPEFKAHTLNRGFGGTCLDELDIECGIYHTHPDFLSTENKVVTETVYSDLLKSNCLMTNQPDWCSVQISYTGRRINHEDLLRYIVSFRNDNEFHEPCIEKIFMQIMQRCRPTELTVYGRSTRRGGIDINAYRSTQPTSPDIFADLRLCRQ